MRTTLLILFWAALLISCKEVSFKTPQPAGIKALREIPPSLQGHYLSYDEVNGEESDTLIIESWGYHFKDKKDVDWLGRGHLSDSLVVKFYKNYYFVNFKSGDQWVLRLIRQKAYGGIEFLSIDIQDDTKRREILKKISKETAVREIHRGEDTFYQITPTPDQLMKFIDKGFFTGSELSKIQ
ncbi:MAG TPA: hypothetical protein PKN99_03305 [Cyclobacteriaceae bacterium]|nr:hypothetical protein [Cyclobacteriaceae bacterium]